MQRTIHIATSLDGFIADKDNSVVWLETISSDPGVFARIMPFINNVDGLVMGRKTYETMLMMGDWAYPGKPCLVVTRSNAAPTTSETFFIRPEEIMDKATALGIQRLWVVGGGMLNGYMVERGWVDEMFVTVAPIILGQGQSLMATLGNHKRLRLREVFQLPDGFVELSYDFER